MASFRIVSFNIRLDKREPDVDDSWAGERRDNVALFLQELGADLIGLQEVKPSQLSFLADALSSEYAHVGFGREKGKEGEASPLFYRKSRFEVVRWQQFWLSETPEVVDSKFEGAGCTRVVTCVHLKQTDGIQLFAFNTHLDHLTTGGTFAIQAGQASILTRLIDDFCGAETHPRVIVGDFNSPRTLGAPPTLLSAGYNECSAGDDTATFVDFDDTLASSGAINHIDWIFIRDMMCCSYSVLHGKYVHSNGQKRRNLSDHLAISARLRLPGAATASPCSTPSIHHISSLLTRPS
mmetsp:Transcript_40262/g.92574  ORF Transcript_40262/g.92574 Transcript_40262/m.92574 type:complete len:294 (+) Transcript_40262:31-912(+)